MAGVSANRILFLDAAQRSANYLIRQIRPDGRLTYRRDAGDPTWRGSGYNLLRHAGALMALADALPLLDPNTSRGALQKALEQLLQWLEPIGGLGNGWAAWSRPNRNDTVTAPQIKLGGTALTLLALLRLQPLWPQLISINRLKQLGSGLLWMQEPNGSFRSKWIPEAGDNQPTWTSLFYPGQAILALTQLSLHPSIDHPERWQEAAHRGLLHLAEQRRDVPPEAIPLDHWILIAHAAWPHRLEQPLLAHVRQIVEAMLRRQQRRFAVPNLTGAFSSSGSSTTTATCLEGLQAAAPLLRHDLSLSGALHQACRRGSDYLLRAQLREGLWDGAMPGLHGRRPTEVRIDYVQHALAAFLGEAQRLSHQPTATAAATSHTRHHQLSLWLQESLDLGLGFLLGCQQADGQMRYLLPLDGSPAPPNRHQVREAGGLWGLALYLHRPVEGCPVRAAQRQAIWVALERGMAAMSAASRQRWGRRWPVPAQAQGGMLGTAALYGLALVEMLAQADCPERSRFEQLLEELLAFVISCRCDTGRFHARYDLHTGLATRDPSPYYDGEALLLLARTARLLERIEYRVPASQAGDAMYDAYAAAAIKGRQRSDLCKGFYQWGSLAFHELQALAPEESRWQQRTLAMADWILSVHEVLSRRRNTAYAFEGLITAWRLARLQGDNTQSTRLRQAVEQGLGRLAGWQLGSSLQLQALQRQCPFPPQGLGGVLSAPDDPLLRIDTTQHQMHALLLAERYLLHDRP